MSERVGVSSVGVSGVSGVSRVSDVSDRRTSVLGPLDLCPGTAGPVSWDRWTCALGPLRKKNHFWGSVGVSGVSAVSDVSEFDTIDTR